MNPFQDPPSDLDQSAFGEPPAPRDPADHAAPQSAQRQSTGDCNSMEPQSLPALPALPASQRTLPTLSEKAALVRSLKGKEKEWTAVAEKKRPLQLLDLPVDILKEIIDKVSRRGCRCTTFPRRS
jgi:hypothetical protein